MVGQGEVNVAVVDAEDNDRVPVDAAAPFGVLTVPRATAARGRRHP
jgi:hypothetical protein